MNQTVKREIANDARIRLRLNNLQKIADRSVVHTYHTGAMIFNNNGMPVSVGWNHYSARYDYFRKRYPSYARSIHAEIHAILRATNRQDLANSEIYVLNLTKAGNVANGKPCLYCQDILFEAGIQRAYFSINPAEYGILELR